MIILQISRFFDKIIMDVSEQRTDNMLNKRNKILNITALLTVLVMIFSSVGLVAFAEEAYSEYSVSAYASDTDFEKSISAFPKEYRPYLRELHVKYPQWTFIPFETGLDWKEVIDNEFGIKNLVSDSASSENLKSKESGHYNRETGKYIHKDAGFVVANRLAVEYYMDPRNFLNEESIFQFEELTFSSAVTIDDVESVLKGSFMANKKITYYNAAGELKKGTATYAQRIYEAGEKYNVNPCYLASKIRNEVGADGSGSVSGTNETYPGIYNFYNIGATDGVGAIERGLKWASEGKTYERPWNNPGKSIRGGAQYIAEKYIAVGQHTGYLQKFNVNPNNTAHSLYTHQYMTNLTGACSQGYTSYTAYAKNGTLYQSKSFSIPVYENMPHHETDVQKLSNVDSMFQYAEISADSSRVRTGPSTNNAQLYDKNGNAILLAKGTDVRIMGKTFTDAKYYISTLKYPHWVRIQFSYNSKTYTGYVPEDFVKYTSHTSVGIGQYTVSHFKGKDVKPGLVSSDSTIAKVGYDNTVEFLKKGTVYLTSFDSAGRYDIVKYVVTDSAVVLPEDVNLVTDSSGARIDSSSVEGAIKYNFGVCDENGNVITCIASDTYTAELESLSKSSKYTVSARVRLGNSSNKIYSPCYTREFSGDGIMIKPNKVANFCAESKGSDVKFIWDEAEFCDGYAIYGYRSSTGKYTEIATLSHYENFYETDRSALTYDKYYIRAFSDAGDTQVYSEYSDALILADAPPVPENLLVSAVTTSSVTLGWDKVKGADSYYIYEIIGGEQAVVGTTSKTSYTVNGLALSEEKVYAVASCKSRMISENSETVYAMTAPETVFGLKSENVTDNSLTLRWDDAPGAYYYNIYMLKDGEYTIIAKCEDSQYHLSDLNQFEEYSFRVSGVAQGEYVTQAGEMSEELQVITSLSKIEDVTVDNIKGNNVTLSWLENPAAEKYTVYVYSEDENEFVELTSVDTAHITVQMERFNAEYTFVVKASATKNNTVYYSPLSDSAKATTTYPVPENIRVSEVKSASYKLTWTKIPDAVSYKIYRLKNDSYVLLANVSSNSYTVGNLTMGQIDSYKITAVYKDGTKKPQSDYSKEIIAATTPDKVKNLKATVANKTAKLTWNTVDNADYYNVYHLENSEYTYLGIASDGSFTAENLTPGKTYEFVVRAYIEITDTTVKGNTASVKVTTKPDKVTSVKVSNPDNYGHTLTWSKANGANYYHIYRYSSADGKYVLVAKTDKLTYTFSDLSAGKTYSYKIKSVYTKGGTQMSISDFSAVFKFATTPKKVTNLKASSVGTTSVNLTWSKSSGVTYYQVSVYDSAQGKYVVYGTAETNSITVKKLKSKSTLKAKVRAVRTVGNKKYYGNYSSVLSVKTK